MTKNSDKLKDLEQAENALKSKEIIKEDNNEPQIQESSHNEPNILDGFKPVQNYELPQEGIFYPESWAFAYRCPKSEEVANFSTIADNDQPGMLQAVEDLIRKCVVIYDTRTKKQISTGEILDGHRQFWLLKLREYYLLNNPIKYSSICTFCHESMDISLEGKKLKYKKFNDDLLNLYDGRKFSFPFEEESIDFLIPTLNTSSRIFKYLMKTYKENTSDRDQKDEKIVYDKKFLLLAPYLYETGTETVQQLINKYNKIKKNDNLLSEYIEIINNLKLDNYDYIDNVCEHCGSEEEAPLRFPGGWKQLFIGKGNTSKYFNN
jgi:hypothetical protein